MEPDINVVAIVLAASIGIVVGAEIMHLVFLRHFRRYLRRSDAREQESRQQLADLALICATRLFQEGHPQMAAQFETVASALEDAARKLR